MSGSDPFAEGIKPALVYFGYRSAAWLAVNLPTTVGNSIARFGADVAHRFVPARRNLVRRNLARVIGDVPELDNVVKEAFRSYAEYWLETFRLSGYSQADIERLVTADDASITVLDEAFADGKGVLLATGHIGFYDLGVAWVGARGYPFSTVAEVLKPRALFEWFAGIRSKWGWTVIPAERGQLARKMSKILLSGECIALLSDRDLRRQGVWVDFFGEKTTFPASPALLIARKQIPLITGAVFKRSDGFKLEFRRLDYELSGDEQQDLKAVAQIIVCALEDLIRKAPEQWHLFSTNWPSDETHLPPRGREGGM